MHNLSKTKLFIVIIILASLIFGVFSSVVASVEPFLLVAAFVAIISVVYFFTSFETAVLGLLCVRTSLDVLSDYQVPSAYLLGLDVLTILYVIIQLLTNQKIKTDKFWCFFAVWILLQSLWVILLPFGGLGLGSSLLSESVREWIRLFSLLMVYLLVLQLKGKLHPKIVVSTLFFSLVLPLIAASMQVVLPESILPSFLNYQSDGVSLGGGEDTISRVSGTLGHPNGFAKLIFLFIGLTFWKVDTAKDKLPWLLLLGTLIFFLVSTKSLFAFGMFSIFVILIALQRLTPSRLFGGLILLMMFAFLFGSSDYGQERLNSLYDTPLLNPDIDASKAILLQTSYAASNSFNWRIMQWYYLLEAWQYHPILGYGLQASPAMPVLYNYAHNDYVRALVEEGIIGFALFILFLGVQLIWIINCWKKAKKGSEHRSLCSVNLAIFSSQLIAMFTDNVWSNTTFLMYWFIMFLVIDWDWNETKQIDQKEILIKR